MADQDIWYMYVLECQNGNLDTGITNNVQRRILEHKFGKGGKFTKDLGVKQMLYKEDVWTKEDARKREVQIKGWTHRKKLICMRGDSQLLKKL